MQRIMFPKSRRIFNLFFVFPLVFIFFIVTIGLIFTFYLSESNITAENIYETKLMVLVASLVFSVLVIVINFILSKRITDPIGEILDVAEALRQGDYSKKMKKIPKNELGYLGETLNHLGEQIVQQITKISHEKTQLKTMLTGMVEGIISINEKDEILFCNRSAYNILNHIRKDYRGLKLNEAFHIEALAKLADRARNSKELVEEEISIGPMGHKTTIDAYASAYSKDGMSGVIIVLNDVTQMLHLERIRRDFVANVSHEIKTPLTAIRGYAETLLNGAIDDPLHAKRFVQKIENNALRLHSLVQDLLSLAHIEASEENFLRVIDTDWAPIIKSVISSNEDEIKRHKLNIKFPDLSQKLIVLGDKEAMYQVLNNLITNAVRYSPDNGVITIQFQVENDCGILSVSDTGIGIPEKDLERIFERFYRVDKARSRERGGTGLGLSIVKNLVTKMDGKIDVTSDVGIGSTFSVVLKR